MQLDAVEVRGLDVVVDEIEDEILEGQQHPGIDLEGEVQIERAAARVLGVEIDLPRLAEGVGLHEMTFVVDVETVIDRVILQIGDESGNVDDRQLGSSLAADGDTQACHAPLPSRLMTTRSDVAAVLAETADAIHEALRANRDWGPSGRREGQYRSDLAADAAARSVLRGAGFGILSEESGLTDPDAEIVVVLDPLDGSTNASRGLSWWATSLCAVDRDGPLEALVCDLRHGTRWTARRGAGARRDDEPVRPSGCTRIGEAILGLNGLPERHGGWAQYRALGACALDLCAVADGTLDGYVDATIDELGVWDYLGAMLVCREAGAPMVDAAGRDLVTYDPNLRRIPVAAASPELLADILPVAPGSRSNR